MIYRHARNNIEEFCCKFKKKAVNYFGDELPYLSLYLRGSFISECNARPLDIDFVLLVENEDKYDDDFRHDFVNFVSENFPEYPHADISVYSNNLANPKSLYGRLLISNSSLLILGKDSRINLHRIYIEKNRLFNYYINHCNERIVDFSNCSLCEAEKRAPHLAKAVLRLGGLLLMTRGRYSRDVVECSDELLDKLPGLDSSISALKKTFNDTVNIDLALKSSKLILIEFEKFVNIR